LHRSISRRQLVALYCAADVMMVTPLRDGMNLVAKEFVASRVDGDGVLMLSEFAGAAAELGEAIVVNPYDVDAVATAIKQALMMEPAERRARMHSLRRRVVEYDVHHWAARFVDQLRVPEAFRPCADQASAQAALAERIEPVRKSAPLTLVLDYDGTLVPIASAPDLAVPDADLLSLLVALAARPSTDVHVVSGRPRDVLDGWFSHLPISLWAEHGFWHRPGAGSEWLPAMAVPTDWANKVYPILEHFTASTPGSLIEKKSASVAWHYRIAHAEFGTRQAHELRMLLGDALSNQPLEVFEGKKVIEVRLRGVNKGLAAHRILAAATEPASILAIGDDLTDEDLFAALPESSITIAVGRGPSRAKYRLPDCHGVRALLHSLIS
jgi:trehalose 6-phosphate synthase/phosphatase